MASGATPNVYVSGFLSGGAGWHNAPYDFGDDQTFHRDSGTGTCG
jgi:hypothetical protein